MKVSTKPWGTFKESDYTLEQWCRARLIRLSPKPKNKAECKLPVHEPDGTLNRNGVIAAALSGARGGVKAPPEQKRKAERALWRLYRQLKMQPPESIRKMAK